MSGGARGGRRSRASALAANAVLALSIVLTPWYALAAYMPSGWQATWLLRLALAIALVNIVALRVGRPLGGLVRPSLAALALIVFRVAVPPDFGFDFAGLEVGVHRRWGCGLGLAAALVAAAVPLGVARKTRH